MAAKENFFKAMKELTGMNIAEEDSFQYKEPLDDYETEQDFITKPYDNNEKKEMDLDKRNVTFEREEIPDYSKKISSATIISASMIVTGEVKSKGDIEILGTIKGPILTSGNMNIEGKILGNIQAQNITLKGCAVQGNIIASGNITLDTNSVVVGDIQASNIKINGKLKGNLYIKEMIELNKDAIVDGDASSRFISMSQGAALNGKVSIISDERKDDGIFNIKFEA
ncbi:bactofilin family protein [Anaerovorax odorimutans]|uniref:bactofilin family protein n=1 Tax=Anaerovorax odorimutans TaxID=109327 RepID=UPI0004244F52|nr:polymer-forming cytoskeletal protein [Anaerovorax odorimutans]